MRFEALGKTPVCERRLMDRIVLGTRGRDAKAEVALAFEKFEQLREQYPYASDRELELLVRVRGWHNAEAVRVAFATLFKNMRPRSLKIHYRASHEPSEEDRIAMVRRAVLEYERSR